MDLDGLLEIFRKFLACIGSLGAAATDDKSEVLPIATLVWLYARLGSIVVAAARNLSLVLSLVL